MPSSGSRNKTTTRPRGVCGRADLVAALADGDEDLARAVAEFTGFDWQPRPSEREEKSETEREQDQGEIELTEPTREEIVARPLVETPFWLPLHLEPIEVSKPSRPRQRTLYGGWKTRPTDPPPIPLLADWRELEPKLRHLLCLPQESRAVDMELTVRRISRGHFLAVLPRERHRRWGPSLRIIEDRSRRLIPYRLDQYFVHEALRRLVPPHALSRGVFRDGMRAPRLVEDSAHSHSTPSPGTLVLVLGDLGCLSIAPAELCEYWLRFGRDLRAAGCTPVALIPGPLERCPARLAGVWCLIPWERPRPCDPADTLELRAERLLRLVSPAVRIEPGLLRAARLLLAPAEADAGTEADVWQHADLLSRSVAGATLNPKQAKQLHAEFASRIEPELQARFAVLLRTWRGYLPEEIWFEELLNLPSDAQTAAEVAQDLPYARNYFADFARIRDDGFIALTGGDLEWFGRVEGRTKLLWNDEQVGDDLKRLSYTLHERDPNYQPPAGFEPALISRPDKPVSQIVVRQRGGTIEFVVPEASHDGSLLAQLTSRNGLIQVENTFWKSCKPPSWAEDWGMDEYGHWVTFSITDKQGNKVTQRMRWIEPGTFLMGSPEDEPERFDREGPQHEVTLTQGFWLFDTACTQALWEAVMGNNPSRFKGANRPVENVNWQNCQDFLRRLNERLPGLDLKLPSEAQWEYACRAGTKTPFSFGANITPEQVNYNGNYPYAGGKEGLYRQETVPVASLPPNSWGLYEMHGNVYEWTQDHWHGDYEGAPADGSAWEDSEAGAGRVIRGGSWILNAQYVRAAYRYWDDPGGRGHDLGFRCARVQVSQADQAGAEPAGPAPGRQAERRPAQGRAGGAAVDESPILLRLDNAQPLDRCTLPQAPAFLIRTDREHLCFGRLTKPPWAKAIGRDHFGLWSEIAVDPGRGEPVIQRLRWIPPGRFWMGSPKDEPGRYGEEGPQHQVTLSHGYWLFDTPCTQALWEAVMSQNPSDFQSPTRPVEQVSWDDVQGFLGQINERISGLDLVLPSEAQWEYACRAGTETAIYTGKIEILGERNAPALDPIAWYGGNSGVDFDLENGYDSSDWKEKQYPHERAGTRPVGLKQANPWGLYDMLGNVWEWCQDGVRGYDDEAQTNPVGPLEAGAGRVIRGGSWFNYARHVRAAGRDWGAPDNRDPYLGFRCARVQA